jgi:hypothetical protein
MAEIFGEDILEPHFWVLKHKELLDEIEVSVHLVMQLPI